MVFVLGLQLLCKSTEEGNTDCLGIFDVLVRKFPKGDPVPHMGWNNFTEVGDSLFEDIQKEDDMYFVHSYYAELSESTIAAADYMIPFSADSTKR